MSNPTDAKRSGSGSAPFGEPMGKCPGETRLAEDPVRRLERLAALLRRPPRFFFEEEWPAISVGPVDPSETLDLVRLFLQVRDPAARAECIAFVRDRAAPR